jgi:DNA-directed RNA polymerase specialized sigma24 family protein
VSPLSLRRFRAERLLRDEFEALRGRVLASVRGRLLASGVSLDRSDLEACYAQAWQGLYGALLDGQEVANPTGWLVLVTYRRAIEEHRARSRVHGGGGSAGAGPHGAREWADAGEVPDGEHDLAAALDDRIRLRALLEGMRARLNAREREAASLCYLQGLSRAEAAARMGLSEARMRKLMEGRASGRPGVAGKVAALVQTIREGGWCEEQASLMRALAYGLLDPDGERYRLAVMHRSGCPACRAYVLSLRGLAVVLPPTLTPLAPAGAAVAGAGSGGLAAQPLGAGLGSSSLAGAGAGATAGAGAGATGGGWLFAGGPLGAKLAVGCLLALGLGAGCVALSGAGHRAHGAHRALALGHPAAHGVGGVSHGPTPLRSTVQGPAAPGAASSAARVGPARGPQAGGGREFSPEQPALVEAATRARLAGAAPPPTPVSGPATGAPGAGAAAEREFSPG